MAGGAEDRMELAMKVAVTGEASSSKREDEEGGSKRKTEEGPASASSSFAAALGPAAAVDEEEKNTGGDEGEWIPGGKVRLPKEYVDWILSRKRELLEEDPDDDYSRMISNPDWHEVYTQEFLEEERELMRDMAALYQRSGDRLERLQGWVHLQLEEKGYVEVGEAFLLQRAMLRQLVTQEQWDVMFNDLKLDDQGMVVRGAGGVAVGSD